MLLRRLARLFPRDAVRAFADDIGIVLNDVRSNLKDIASLFEEFLRFSNLHLNISKCIAVPLQRGEIFDHVFSALIASLVPSWSGFKVQDAAEYLGFLLGPGSVGKTWSSAVKKASDAMLRWRNLHTGFFFNLLASNVYILHILLFGSISESGLSFGLISCLFEGYTVWRSW